MGGIWSVTIASPRSDASPVPSTPLAPAGAVSYDGGVPNTPRPVTTSEPAVSARVSAALLEFTTGFRQFWQGYWQSPPGA